MSRRRKRLWRGHARLRHSPERRWWRRRLIDTEKFYLFNVGVTNYRARRAPRLGTPEFGSSLEQFILMELQAYRAYRNPEMDIAYWRTSTSYEVDFIIDDMQLAIEVKSAQRVGNQHLRGLRALKSEFQPKRSFLVCLEKESRETDDHIEIVSWDSFLDLLWDNAL